MLKPKKVDINEL